MKKNYLGQKGYSIWKKNLSIDEQNIIRQELMVQPIIPKSPIKPESFPIYLESPEKIYVPRYYGINKYGIPDIKIDKGKEINVIFNGELRDYQKNIVNKFIEHVTKTDIIGGGLIDLPCGRGKTVIAIKILTLLKRKTLIIVHKGFLLNQWIERIKEFCPNAKIGLIQGQIIDIEDKDIVIGMLQSLSLKEYPQDQFKSFGLTIFDECHHISSETFSRAMQKIVTQYSLGLSATMNRKDGLTKVFKLFLGEIVYKEKREDDGNVLVKAIYYKNNDDEFNTIEYDFRGNPKYSTMISKISDFNNRSEFLIKIIENEFILNNDQQILFLAHRKSLLNYIFKALEHRNIASVGYYIGGMKEKDLKESETKKVILATYQMAEEGLDIKTLSTLLLSSSKTDIVQAVGRILRIKHKNPLIIDIVDMHDIFQNQFNKRRSYYIKNKYKIITTDNNLYLQNNYKINYDPSIQESKTNSKTNSKTDSKSDNKTDKSICLIDINF